MIFAADNYYFKKVFFVNQANLNFEIRSPKNSHLKLNEMKKLFLSFALLKVLTTLVPVKALHRLDTGYRLPQNYVPEKQNLKFKYLAEDSKVVAETSLEVTNVDENNWKTLTLHAYQLNISSVQVMTQEGDEIPTSYRLVDWFEILEIEFRTDIRPGSSKLTVIIDYELVIKKDGKTWGIYSPFYSRYASAKELVTFFEPAFARTVFPTFDEPLFRFRFSFSIEIHQDPLRDLGLVLFNSDLQNSYTSEEFRYFQFKETVPMPAYLVEIAVLNPTHYVTVMESSYFQFPIRVFSDDKYYDRWLKSPESQEKLDQIIKFTLTYCESRFEVPWKMSEKIDFLITEMQTIIGGMEHPGLILISAALGPDFPSEPADYATLFTVIIHEIIHQWTGGLLTNDWWSNFWLNEGFTSFLQSEITRELIKFSRLPLESNKVDLTHNLQPFSVVENVDLALAKDTMSFWGFNKEFYMNSMRAVALLDAAMGNNLMVCLGVIFQNYPFRSFNSKFVLDELSQCPYSTVNATDFMRFWLFDEEIPVLKISMQDDKTSVVSFSYDFICVKDDFANSTCFNSKPNFKPRFALTFRDEKNALLEDAILVTENNTNVQLSFNVSGTLFFTNTFNQGNFLVQYPERNYLLFFEYLGQLATDGVILPPFYRAFVTDMFELSIRKRIDLYWTLAILLNRKNLIQVGILKMNGPVDQFADCLDAELFVTQVDKDSKMWLFVCFWSNDEFATCEEKIENVLKFPPKVSAACKKWVAMFGDEFKELMSSGSDFPDKTITTRI